VLDILMIFWMLLNYVFKFLKYKLQWIPNVTLKCNNISNVHKNGMQEKTFNGLV